MEFQPGAVVSLTVNSASASDAPFDRNGAVYASGCVSISCRTPREPQGFHLISRQIFRWSVAGDSLHLDSGGVGEPPLREILRRPDSEKFDPSKLNAYVEDWLIKYLHPNYDLFWVSLLWQSFLEPLREAWTDACKAIPDAKSKRRPMHEVQAELQHWDWVKHTKGVTFTIGQPDIELKASR